MLEVRHLNAFYGTVQVLHDVNLLVGAAEIVGLVGANAAGKSTLMFTLAGLRTTHLGDVLLDGVAGDDLPAYERPKRGLVLVPERRRLFPFMTVLENLEIGAYASAARAVAARALSSEALTDKKRFSPGISRSSTTRLRSVLYLCSTRLTTVLTCVFFPVS